MNSPLASGGLSLDLVLGIVELTLGGDGAVYYSYNWKLAKMRYGIAMEAAVELGRFELFVEPWIGRYDYGDNDDDALRYGADGGIIYDFKVLKRHRVMIREIELSGGGEYSDARSDTSTYLKADVDLGVEFKLWETDLDIGIGGAYRKYFGMKEHTITEQILRPENFYATLSTQLEIPIWSGLSTRLGGVYRFKNSTYLPYKYDRYTLHAGLKWRSRFVLGKQEKRNRRDADE